VASDDGAYGVTSEDTRRVAADLREAARLVRNLPDNAPDKAALQHRLAAVTSAAKHDVGRAADRLARLLEDLQRGG
jgi:hypothetical protein